MPRETIDELPARARQRLERVTAGEALDAVRHGAILAAATLQDLGFTRATDLVGGFRAWAAAGLPVVREVAPGDDSGGGRVPAAG